MIETLALGPDVSRVTAQLAGDQVVVLAFVCPSREAAGRLLAGIDRRFSRAAARLKARTKVAATPVEPDDPFAPGKPARLSTYAWDHGEMAIDVIVVRRVSATRLLVRTRMGRVAEVHQDDLARGRRAS
ncbi:hypothetical protein [Methylopila sp. M107]|uniref:hypothetical protein n=1 Tax=Methylopila sp. M107 TaxID=1101190 RepID=UPI000374E6F4|nr:hypothetical protein [Methylopila sp. M107]